MDHLKELIVAADELRSSARYRTLESANGLAFIDNDYLGISRHPDLIKASTHATKMHGTGGRGSRLLGGHSSLFDEVEAQIAEFFRAPCALLFSSGFLANLALMETVGHYADEFITDERIHRSLIDGIRLSRKPKQIIAHNDWPSYRAKPGRRVLVAESLYSMDGDFADFAAIEPLLQQGMLILDEAHAAGVFFEEGRGKLAQWQRWDCTVGVVTFGKAFGAAGAAVLCRPDLRDLLINRASSFIFNTALPPGVVASIGAATQVLSREAWRREELWERAQLVRRILGECPGQRHLAVNDDWTIRSPILPFKVAGEERALRFAQIVRQNGIYLRAIRYPTVALGHERLRISLSLAVGRDETEAMAKELVELWKGFL